MTAVPWKTREVGYIRGKSMSSVVMQLGSNMSICRHHLPPWAHSKLLSVGVANTEGKKPVMFKVMKHRFQEQCFKKRQSYVIKGQRYARGTHSPQKQQFAKIEKRDTGAPEITDSSQNLLPYGATTFTPWTPLLSTGKNALQSVAWILFLTIVSKNTHLVIFSTSLFTHKRKKELDLFLRY